MFPRFKLERRHGVPFWVRIAVPVFAVVISFIVTSPLVIAAGANPLRAFYYLVISPFSKRSDFLEIAVEALPLILTGLSVTVAFTARFYNIGAEGQLYAGAIAAAWGGVALGKLPAPVLIPLIFLLGFLGGAIWCLVPALLKLRRGLSEVVSTLLLNWVIVYLAGALLSGPWLDPVTKWPQSPEIVPAAHLPILIPGSRVNISILFAFILVSGVYWLLKNTTLGFEIRTFGANPHAARYAKMKEWRTILIVALISGGLAGLAGVMEVCGKHFHLIQEISPGYGYTGIIVATLGGLNPLGTLLSAFFLGALGIGAQTMHRMTQTPVPLSDIEGSIILLAAVFVMEELSRYRVVLKRGED